MMRSEKAEHLADEERPGGAERRLGERGLNDQTKKRLGLHLRAMYETMVKQPVPDRFKELIAKLDDGDKPDKTS